MREFISFTTTTYYSLLIRSYILPYFVILFICDHKKAFQLHSSFNPFGINKSRGKIQNAALWSNLPLICPTFVPYTSSTTCNCITHVMCCLNKMSCYSSLIPFYVIPFTTFIYIFLFILFSVCYLFIPSYIWSMLSESDLYWSGCLPYVDFTTWALQ